MTEPSRGTTPGSPAEASADDHDGVVAEEAVAVVAEGEGEAGAGGEAKSAEDAAAGPSEAEEEIAAQRELRARIARRKAEKEGPIPAGAKLSGQAADLLAAVRAMESGQAAPPAPVTAPVPAQDRPRAPEPARGAAVAATTAPEALAAVGDVLAQGGAPQTLAAQVTAALGEQAGDALREDPWLLLSVPGVQPKQADGFARALLGDGCGPGDERRAAALVGWLLERAAVRGNTALAYPQARAALAERSVPDPDEALRHAVAEGAVLMFQDGVADAEGVRRTRRAPPTVRPCRSCSVWTGTRSPRRAWPTVWPGW